MSAPPWLADVWGPDGGFGLSRPLEQGGNPPAIKVCKLAGSLPAGTLVTMQLTGTFNGAPTTETNVVDVGTVCFQNEYVNFGNQFDLGTQVFIQETAPPDSRIQPGSGCAVIPTSGSQTPLPCNVDATGVASFFLPSRGGGGQLDVILTNGGAHLEMLKVDALDPAVVGQDLEYEFAVVNDGPEAAENV